MKKRRLMMVVNLLEKLPPGRFDFMHWVGGDWKGDADLSCGTTACALGWATTIPALRKAGLYLRKDGSVRFRGLRRHSHWTLSELSIMAAAKAFGITPAEAWYLFVPGADVGDGASAKKVARHIRRFMARGGILG